MNRSERAALPGGRSTMRRRIWALVAVAGTLAVAYGVVLVGEWATPKVTAAQQSTTGLAGTGRIAGTVTAPKPFTAARVYLFNTDKRIMYQAFTEKGQFRAVALFPGNYEVSAKTDFLASDTQKVAIRAGDNPKLSLAMKETTASLMDEEAAPPDQSGAIQQATQKPAPKRVFESYDTLYPDNGPGKQVAEQVCMVCHGENFFPSRPASADVWLTRIGHMQGTELEDRDASSYAEGLLAFRSNMFRFSLKDRQDLIDYLVKNFPPGSAPRLVKTERPMPLDEAKLGKALFIEYYMNVDGPTYGVNAPEFKGKGRRYIQDPRFDTSGNVWLVDRGIPERLVKVDPRTGAQKEFLYPDPINGNHEVMIDRDGMILLPEHRGLTPSNTKRLLFFNPETEKFDKMIPMDPNNEVRNSIKWMQSIALDSKGNVYIGWIMGGALSKYEKATGRVKVYRMPEPHAIPYGVIADANDRIWVALWSGGKLVRFDPENESFASFTPPTYPGQMRRPNVDYENNIWTGIWSGGSKRPGKIVKLDQRTQRWTEWAIPQQNSQPYDVAPDPQGNIWFTDSPAPDRPTALGVLNPKTGQFTFYPKPQPNADTPKIQITRDGAVWFAPRGSRDKPAISVLYTDMDKITTLGAYYLNGPPGYPFKVTQTSQTTTPRPVGGGQ